MKGKASIGKRKGLKEALVSGSLCHRRMNQVRMKILQDKIDTVFDLLHLLLN